MGSDPPKHWVPHPSLLFSEGWDTTNLDTAPTQNFDRV